MNGPNDTVSGIAILIYKQDVFFYVGWQVTLCGPIWQATPCSSVILPRVFPVKNLSWH